MKVSGDWTASNLVAGVMNTASSNANFGNMNDASIGAGSPGIIAKIASIAIGGVVTGTVGGTDHFGFSAQQIGSFTIAGTAIPLAASPSSRDIGATGDVTIREVM